MKARYAIVVRRLRSCKPSAAAGKIIIVLSVMELIVRRIFSKANFVLLVAASLAAALVATPASALTAPNRQALAAASADGVTKVHSKRYHHKHHRKHTHKHRRHRSVVEAPFTRVETGHRYRRGVLVDAPFAFVTVGRHGRYVRAPFVDLWVPH